MKKLGVAIFFTLLTSVTIGQELERKSLWGARFSFTENQGLIVKTINNDGSLHKTGIKEGDTILKIGSIQMNSSLDYSKARRYYKSGKKVSFLLKKGNNTKTIKIKPKSYPYEKEEGLDIIYHSLISKTGDNIRVIETKPINSKAKLPTIIFVPWLSCASVEKPVNSKDGWIDMFYGLAKSGFNVIRIDKPGVGDSLGPDCSEYGFDYELNVYESIIQKLLKQPYVNANELFLWGGSMGGSMAPIIIDHLNLNVKGVIISGSFYKTWYEHMLEIERRMAVLNGKTPVEINDYMLKVAEFYNYYLNKKQTPKQILSSNPILKDAWSEDSESHQYGRPIEYYMEANNYNIPKHWDAVKTPVLVIHGEYDWIMTNEDHTMIVDHMQNKGLKANFISVPKMDHNFNIYESIQASYDDSSQKFDKTILDRTVKWIKSIL